MPSLADVLEYLYSKVVNWLRTASPGTLQLTGVLGFALLVIGYYQIRGPGRGAQPRQPGQQDTRQTGQEPRPGGGPSSQHQGAAGLSSTQAGAQAAAQGKAPVAAPGPGSTLEAKAVYTHLVGVKRVTVSLPGVLFIESTAVDLQDAATVLPAAAACLTEVCRLADTYFLTQVVDDVGQAVVLGALESAGLVGTAPGQVKPHKVLFCSTLEGKNSLVRQIEPDLHIDGHSSTVEDLARFLPQMVHVHSTALPACSGAPNVGNAPSLPAFFGL